MMWVLFVYLTMGSWVIVPNNVYSNDLKMCEEVGRQVVSNGKAKGYTCIRVMKSDVEKLLEIKE